MLHKDLLAKLRRIEIRTSRLANEQMAGQYRSVFKGHGINFDEVRPYQPGDDIRSIDWNVSARTGEPFVKVFVEERELTVFLVLDMSASAGFGTKTLFRNEFIAEVAAVLAFSAIKNNDRVGLIIFGDEVEHFVPPRKGRTHVLRVIRDILTFTPRTRGTSGRGIVQALKYLSKVTKKTSVAFVLSDFLVADEHVAELKTAMSIARSRHDLLPLMARDPMDDELPDLGLVEVEDPETGETCWLDTSSRAVREDFRRASFAQSAQMESLFKGLSLDFLRLYINNDNYITKFNQLFERRARRF